MKKLFSAFIVAVLIFSLAACSKEKDKVDLSQVSIGVWRSTEERNKSYLTFYDKNLNELATEEFPYGGLNIAPPSPINNNKAYVIPLGRTGTGEWTFVMEYDYKTGESRKLEIGKPCLYSVAVDDEAVYTSNRLNAVTSLIKCDKATGKIKKYDAADMFFSELYVFDQEPDLLFAISQRINGPISESLLISFDKNTLEPLDVVVLSLEVKAGDLILIGDTFYCTINDTLVKYNRQTEKQETIKLEKNDAFQIFKFDDNHLLVTHGKREDEFYGASIVDLTTGENKFYTFDHRMAQSRLDGNRLYVLDADYLYHYEYSEGKGFRLIKKVDTSGVSSEFNYHAGFFLTGQ